MTNTIPIGTSNVSARITAMTNSSIGPGENMRGLSSSKRVCVSVASAADNEQRNQRYKIEDQHKDLEQAQKRIHHDSEMFLRERKPTSLSPINEIGGEAEHRCPESEQTAVDDGAPEEEVLQCFDRQRSLPR